MIEKLAQDLIDNRVSDFVIRVCDICVSARGIENKCSSGCGPEKQAGDNKEDKTEDQEESET